VNQEGTCGTKMAGRHCRLEKCACEPLLGKEEHCSTQSLFQSTTAQLDALRFQCMRGRPHEGWVRMNSVQDVKKMQAEVRAQMCAGALAHACASGGNLTEREIEAGSASERASDAPPSKRESKCVREEKNKR